jgi:hypothetical protein
MPSTAIAPRLESRGFFSCSAEEGARQGIRLMETTTPPVPAPLTLAQRAKRELIRYLAISTYLYVCLGALLIYKAALLRAEGIPYAAYGLAIVKALILGKFMLLAETFHFGEHAKASRMAVRILIKSAMFAALLIALTFIEEVIVGLVHGEKAAEVARHFAGGTWPQAFATALLMVLIMVPYFAFGEISASMGEGELTRLLIDRKPRESGAGEAA